MANELVHATVGTTMTQLEFEAVGLHVLNSQATGDLIYASSASQLTRLGIGSTNAFLVVTGGIPAWSTEPVVTDDLHLHFGTDSDGVLLNRSTALNANTALTGALVGTPVSQALAANSFILSNITADGDVAFYGNLAGNSQQFLFYDTSASQLSLLMGKLKYSTGAFAFQESTTISSTGTLTINAFTLGGNIAGAQKDITDIASIAVGDVRLGGTNQITLSNTTSYFTIRAAAAGVAGANIQFHGVTSSGAEGAILVHTLNAAGTGNIERLRFSGVLATAVATWSAITQTWSSYGAGTITADAGGNLTSVSDERLKTAIRELPYGLAHILQLNSILHKWRPESGMETEHEYPGFDANAVHLVMPEATGMNPDGYRTLQDRGIMGALVNSVKEMNRGDWLKAQLRDAMRDGDFKEWLQAELALG